jgi:hypothetical protein
MGKRFQDVSVSVAANTRTDNVLDGTIFQTLDRPTLITLQETGSAAGLERALIVGSDTKIPQGAVNANNRVPITPDDLAADGIEGYPGQGVFLSVVNTTAGALTYRARIWFEDAMMA